MKRTPNIAYLVIGLVFVGVAASWLLHNQGVLNAHGFQWFLPTTLLCAGLVGLAVGLGKGFAGRRGVAAGPTPYAQQDDGVPVTDLTSDIDRKLEEHQTNTGDQS